MKDEIDIKPNTAVEPAKRHRGRSLFAPIMLIAAGTFFLLSNLGVISQLNWSYLWSFWPLLLIFIGLNMLVTQARAPLGTFLSLLVSLTAVAVFGYLLVSGPNGALTRSLGIEADAAPLIEQPIAVPVDGAQSAEVRLDFGDLPGNVGAGSNDQLLVDGTIWTRGDLVLEEQHDGDSASVAIGENAEFVNFLNPANWLGKTDDHAWQLDLNRDILLDLQIDTSNGATTLDLDDLQLTDLLIEAANGSVTAAMPDGDYDGQISGGNGALQITLPVSGRQNWRMETGNGSMHLLLPQGVPARVDYQTGNGAVSVDDRFDHVEGDAHDGVYETADYEPGGDGIVLHLESGNGSIQISQP